MPLTRSLPPQFLLPAWSSRKLYQVLERAYSSDEAYRSKPRRRPKREPKPAKSYPVSLFDQLFPEERSKQDNERESNITLPPFQWDEGFDFRREETRKEAGQRIPRGTGRQKAPLQEQGTPLPNQQWERHKGKASVLILNCASKTLEESDFFRVSPRGEHIEGWTRSIIKGADSKLGTE